MTDDSGDAMGGAAAQRRTLGLLAALAVAGEGGLSRDKIVGLLWPDSDTERARHSLTQALYAARRALGADDLFLVNADVRLNRQRIACDVGEFEAALEAGDLDRAVALYEGAFLDGFYLSGSPDFEQWASLQRERLEGRMSTALERLAEAAESAGEYRRAVEWRRRISNLRPLDSGNAIKLMTALAESGDRAGALQHAQTHEVLLREQFDLEPDVGVLALARKLRQTGKRMLAHIGGSAGESKDDSPSPRTAAAPGGSSRASWIVALASNRARLIVAVGLVLLAALSAGLSISRGRRLDSAGATVPLRQKVVVAPFRVTGAAPSLAYLRNGIVELLSTRLADDTAARSVDAGAVLGAWEAAGFGTAAAVPRDTVVNLAGRLGAERVVIGSVVGSPSRMVLRAAAVEVPTGAVTGQAVVEGPADSISSLIDGLAAKLLVSQAGEDERLVSYTTGSLPALRAYLAGQAAFRQDDYDNAMRRYQAALELDPAFPLAALRLAVAAGPLNEDERSRQALAQAWSAREALSERDQAMLVALGGPAFPQASSAAAQLSAWRRLVDLAPNDPESWYTLGARLFHDGAVVGMAEPESNAAVSLRRALSIDPDYGAARLLLIHLATDRPRSIPSADLGVDTGRTQGSNAFGPFLQWRITLARADTAGLRRVRAVLNTFRPVTLRAMAMASQFDGIGVGDGARALEVLGTQVTRGADQVDLLLAKHSLAMQLGRPDAAFAVTAQLRSQPAGLHPYLRLRVLDAVYGEGDSAAAGSAARELGSLTSGGFAARPMTEEARLADLCVQSQWRLWLRDTTGVVAAIGALRRAGFSLRPMPPVSAAPASCAELLEAWLSVVVQRRGDALERLERLDLLALTSQTAGDAIAYAPLLMARLFQDLGKPDRALQAIRKRAYMSGWPRYQARAWREEGRLAHQLGDPAGARRAYERYLALRVSPEPGLIPEREQVRQLLGTLPAQASR